MRVSALSRKRERNQKPWRIQEEETTAVTEGAVEVEVKAEAGAPQLQLIHRLPKKMMSSKMKVSIRTKGAQIMDGAEVGEAGAQDGLAAILLVGTTISTIVLVAMAISIRRAVVFETEAKILDEGGSSSP